jgi:hypothetical protein
MILSRYRYRPFTITLPFYGPRDPSLHHRDTKCHDDVTMMDYG